MTNRTPPPHITAALNHPTGGALVARLLTTGHYQWTTEHQLQTALAEWLDRFEVFPELERVLSDGQSRVDLIAGGVVIEVKIAGTWTDVVRQLTRYAHCPEVASLILVTTKAGHEAVPDMLVGKPVSLVWVGGDGL